MNLTIPRHSIPGRGSVLTHDDTSLMTLPSRQRCNCFVKCTMGSRDIGALRKPIIGLTNWCQQDMDSQSGRSPGMNELSKNRRERSNRLIPIPRTLTPPLCLEQQLG
jgi:hypothetical protein